MIKFKRSEIQIIDSAFQSNPGYVLDFSDRTLSEYFEDEFNIDIDDQKYAINGSSKMKRLRTFFQIEEARIVTKVMRSLWEYRESIYKNCPNHTKIKEKLFELIVNIESGTAIARTDAIDRFASNQTLDELIAAIERDITADKPAAALDRLHTYCKMKFAHLLDKRKIDYNQNDPLNSHVGKYVKNIEGERELQKMTIQILKNSIGIFDKFNHIRNNQSLAHHNEILNKAEARFIFDSVSAILRFVKSIDTEKFGD